jgi:hypothetical protein
LRWRQLFSRSSLAVGLEFALVGGLIVGLVLGISVTHEAANPLLGLQEFQPEYDELQVKIRCPRQQGYQGK